MTQYRLKKQRNYSFLLLLHSVATLLLAAIGENAIAQTGIIQGRVYSGINNEPIPFASVAEDSLAFVAASDSNGYFLIDNIKPGTYNLFCTSPGYKRMDVFEVVVNPLRPVTVDFPLTENFIQLKDAQVFASPFNKTEESPVSLRTINSTEIFRSPGANRDISKVIQNLPGVGSTVSFRNDIIVRGGAPNENRFFLDGVEVPNINHFATQGASGGPVGMINVDFIREVDFYSGAFPASRGNALSSILDFKLIEGNDARLRGSFSVGSSDVGLTLDGPLGEKSNFIFSLRRSYLQFVFKALALPFLPTYNDLQFKHTYRIDTKNTLTFIGLAALDDFELNKRVNENIDDPELIERNEFILGFLPVNKQWNYTGGVVYKHFGQDYFYTLALSRNQLKNTSNKYAGNDELNGDLLLDYASQEIENKIRLERTSYNKGWKLVWGAGAEHALYTNSTYQRVQRAGLLFLTDFDSRLTLNKYSAFIQLSRKILEEKISLSAGIRTDFSDYSGEMNNPVKQLSPRASVSIALGQHVFLNANAGRYFQLPPYTVLGYRDSLAVLVNRKNKISYIQNDQFVAGFEYNPNAYSKFTIESFYKKYLDYPFLVTDSISLANLGGDFGVIGNEEATPQSEGRSYGIEISYQKKLSSNYYGILSYTLFKSEFKDKRGAYVPSSWDNGSILNITAGRKLKRNWELGAKFRLLGGAPYTPYDITLSSKKEVWDAYNRGLNDWNRLNTLRLSVFHSLDVRIDKKWFYKKWTLNLYLDIQNIYNNTIEDVPFLTVKRNANGLPEENPEDPGRYETYLIKNTSGNILPSVGLRIEF
jgi:hypothetical protein